MYRKLAECHCACGQELEVASGVPASVAVHPLQPQPPLRGREALVQTEALPLLTGAEEAHGPVPDEDPEDALLLGVLGAHVHLPHHPLSVNVGLRAEWGVTGAETERLDSKKLGRKIELGNLSPRMTALN